MQCAVIIIFACSYPLEICVWYWLIIHSGFVIALPYRMCRMDSVPGAIVSWLVIAIRTQDQRSQNNWYICEDLRLYFSDLYFTGEYLVYGVGAAKTNMWLNRLKCIYKIDFILNICALHTDFTTKTARTKNIIINHSNESYAIVAFYFLMSIILNVTPLCRYDTCCAMMYIS